MDESQNMLREKQEKMSYFKFSLAAASHQQFGSSLEVCAGQKF